MIVIVSEEEKTLLKSVCKFKDIGYKACENCLFKYLSIYNHCPINLDELITAVEQDDNILTRSDNWTNAHIDLGMD